MSISINSYTSYNTSTYSKKLNISTQSSSTTQVQSNTEDDDTTQSQASPITSIGQPSVKDIQSSMSSGSGMKISSSESSSSSSSTTTYTAAEIAQYDTNGDGVIDSTEALAMKIAQASDESEGSTESDTTNYYVEMAMSAYSNDSSNMSIMNEMMEDTDSLNIAV